MSTHPPLPRKPDTPPQPRRGDLTKGPLVKTLLLFALPQLVGNMLQTINTSINAVWVGRLIGNDALAATANANIVMFLIFALVFGFGMAATVRIGQAFGAGDIAMVRRGVGAAVSLTLAIALGTTLAGWLGAPLLLDALATPGTARGLALIYMRIILLSNPFAMATLTLAMCLRGTGDARTPLIVLVMTSLLDILFNPLLIRGFGPIPALGIAGSALSTALATLIGLVAMVVLIYRRDLVVRLRGVELAYLTPGSAELRYILAKGVPMGAQMLVISGAGMIFVGLVNREGLATAAAYGALIQLWNYIQMPAMAMGAAVSAMVAQHIGAGRAGRVDAIAGAGVGANAVITIGLTLLLLIFDRPMLALFLGSHAPALALAEHMQNIAIWSYIPFGVTIVIFGALRAFGVVYTQLIVLFSTMYLLRLGIYRAAHPMLGADALWTSMLISAVASAAAVLCVFWFGPWRAKITAENDGRPHPVAAPVAKGD